MPPQLSQCCILRLSGHATQSSKLAPLSWSLLTQNIIPQCMVPDHGAWCANVLLCSREMLFLAKEGAKYRAQYHGSAPPEGTEGTETHLSPGNAAVTMADNAAAITDDTIALVAECIGRLPRISPTDCFCVINAFARCRRSKAQSTANA